MSNSSFVVVRPFPGSRSDGVAGALTFRGGTEKRLPEIFRSSPKNHCSTFGLEKARPLCPGGGSKKWALISLTNMQVNPVVLEPNNGHAAPVIHDRPGSRRPTLAWECRPRQTMGYAACDTCPHRESDSRRHRLPNRPGWSGTPAPDAGSIDGGAAYHPTRHRPCSPRWRGVVGSSAIGPLRVETRYCIESLGSSLRCSRGAS